MATIQLTVTNPTRERQVTLRVPHDATMDRLVPALLTMLGDGFPVLDRNQDPISYRPVFRGNEIGADQTLGQAGVREGDEIMLSSEPRGGVREWAESNDTSRR